MSYRQAGIYHDLETFYRSTIAKNPQAWLCYENLTATSNRSGVMTKRSRLVREGLANNPERDAMHDVLGVVLLLSSAKRLPTRTARRKHRAFATGPELQSRK